MKLLFLEFVSDFDIRISNFRRTEVNMTVERTLRGIAGAFILASVLLVYYHNVNWIWFTGFVGLNLFQSCFTNWCPMMTLLEKLGLGDPNDIVR